MVGPLITFGGWMSICNLLDPLFLYSDRMILGVVVSMNAVAFYATHKLEPSNRARPV